MPFIVKKKINGRNYFYLRESRREGKKVRAVTIAYLGKNLHEAEEKFKKLQSQKGIMENEEKEVGASSVRNNEHEFTKISIEELANFCKAKGFVFRSSDIYGGFSGFWDFGPLGVELFNNIKQSWWNWFVREKENMVGMEASIISHPRTWKASGHLENFNDMMIYCNKHKKYFRADKLIGEFLDMNVEGFDEKRILEIIKENSEKFKKEGYDLEEDIKMFNLMFETKVGAGESSKAYLRGETAQGMFMDFSLIQKTSRLKLPFGIAQMGRCFRNEISPRDFLFRSREFHIGEFEFFIHPDEKKCNLLESQHLNLQVSLLGSEAQQKGEKRLRDVTIGEMIKEGRVGEWHGYWLAEQVLWFYNLGLKEIKIREHTKDELSHYSSATFDIDYEYPFGSEEVAGNANRGQFDLTQHQKESKESMEIFDEISKTKIVPRVIEPTFGMERVFLATLTKAYHDDKDRGNIVLHLPPKLAPIKAAVFPIVKSEEYEKIATDIVDNLRKEYNVSYDRGGSIGRRYARNDEIGTPYCITVDDKSPKDNDVTIRDRDSRKQIRVKISKLKGVLRRLIDGEIEFFNAGTMLE